MGLFDFIKRLFSKPAPPPRASGNSSISTPGNQRISSVTMAPAPPRPPTLQPNMPSSVPAPRQTPPQKIVKKLDLDASQFAPISSKAALQLAKSSTTVRSNPWWGRLDTIPPASDERTLLIDRTLVAYGLFKPEELVEIHKIGDRMLELQGDQALAHAQASAQVAAADEDRKRLKEQKKKEAAERKRKHAEDVAHRRATDIIFLGRGVSKGLADRRSNIEKLQTAKLPVLSSPADIANAMGITIKRLRWLAFHSDASEVSHYIHFSVPKKSGGTRTLSAPHRDLAKAQRWIFQNILQGLAVHPAAHGFVRGRSICTNARPHVGSHTLVNADLKDFFPSITFNRVLGAFRNLGYSPATATVLALVCTESPRRLVEYAGKRFYVATGLRALPQGACTSPAISNLVSRRMDSRFQGIASKLGWTYTRYADDLSFSAPESANPAKLTGYLLARIRHIAEDEGFSANEKKTRVLKQSTAMSVTGIVVNERAGVCRRDVRRLRAILHNAKKTGLESQNRGQAANFEAQIRGKVCFVQMVNPAQAAQLRTALDNLPRG